MNNREDFEKGITKIINEIAPIKPDEKKSLIESYMLVYDSQQKIIDELKEELEAWKLQDEAGQIVINTLNEEVEKWKLMDEAKLFEIEHLKAENKSMQKSIDKMQKAFNKAIIKLRDRIKQLEENQKWISVEDILPEHEEAVDIYHKDLCRVPDCIYIDPSNYDGVGEKHFFTGKICIYLEDVTHWRKIPDNPPQEKE